MGDNTKIQVTTVEGLYDEKAEAVIMNISHRKRCIIHSFINASLCWEPAGRNDSPTYCLTLEAERHTNFHREWGKGYGGIRYCEKCKLIDCIHLFEDAKTYEIAPDEFYSTCYAIETCRICKRRILRVSWGSYTPSNDAHELISNIAKEFGVEYTFERFPSGYFLDLPYAVSKLLLVSKEQAEALVRRTFARGYIEDEVMHMKDAMWRG